MTDTEFQELLETPATRTAHYKEIMRAYFDRVTDTYRAKWSDSFHMAIFTGSEPLEQALVATERQVADLGGFRPGMKVLDVGCGVGGPALNIAEYSGVHITGVNIVEGQVAIARQRAAERGLSGQTRFEVADGMSMPFAGDSFDAVYIFEAGCHMPDKPRFYRECARVLRPGGVFLGNEWLKKEGLSVEEEETYIEPICRTFSVPHFITLVDLGTYLSDAGLVVEALENAAQHGDIMRNWVMVDNRAIRGIRGLLPWLIPPTLRMLTDGGLALSSAARVGAFLIGHWRARKPLGPGGQP
jgi:ubiquinone/menaquinone biosynthesis C-methylase UbiE